jgi:glycerophosphoryl diester phosphodiesterase
VVCHDPHLLGVEVARSTYATLLATCPDLATFDDVLSQFATRAYLFIELKVCGLEKVVLRTLRAHPPECGYVVASFLPDVPRVMRALSADVPLGLICKTGRELMQWHNLPVSVVMPHYRLATEAVVQKLHAAGKQVFVWTVNRAGTIRQFVERGVDAIVSDDTAVLARAV